MQPGKETTTNKQKPIWHNWAEHSPVAEEVGHAPNCIMVEAVNQSGKCIFLGVNLEEIVAWGMKSISLCVFSAFTS